MENIVGDYQITGTSIARGSFSDVFLGKNRYDNTKVAIKRIKVKNAHKLDKIVLREIEIHSKLKHTNIIQLINHYINYNTHHVYLVMEYCAIGNLKDYQTSHYFTEADIQHIMQQIVAGLQYLYENGVFHRDLKPQNILLDEYRVIKLIDFGLARQFNDAEPDDGSSLFETFCGSPMYMSPEMVQHRKYDTMSDLWSLGVIMYELITGHPPIQAKNFYQLETQIMKPVELPNKYISKLSRECVDLLYRLLQNNSDIRIGWMELFRHPWLLSNLKLQHENLLIENPLAFDLLTHQMFIPKDTHTSDLSGVIQHQPKIIHQLPSGLIRNYSAGAINGLAQIPLSATPPKLPKLPKPPKPIISHKPVFFHSSIGNSYPNYATSPTSQQEPLVQHQPSLKPSSHFTKKSIYKTQPFQISNPNNPSNPISLDVSIQEDFDNIMQEYNIIPTGCDSFESDSSFTLASTHAGSESSAQMPINRAIPITIPRHPKPKADSYDSDFVMMQKDLKFVTPPDHLCDDANTSSTGGFSKFWTSSFRILKNSLRDSYDYLSNNPKSL